MKITPSTITSKWKKKMTHTIYYICKPSLAESFHATASPAFFRLLKVKSADFSFPGSLKLNGI